MRTPKQAENEGTVPTIETARKTPPAGAFSRYIQMCADGGTRDRPTKEKIPEKRSKCIKKSKKIMKNYSCRSNENAL